MFVDETGTHLGYTRTHGWAPRGVRAHGTAPRNHGQNTTVVTAISLAGFDRPFRYDGAMTGVRFVGYIQHILAPRLRPGQVVILDNLRAHHRDEVRTLIEARGARLLYLPSYSPDFNPIELAFSKLKQILRSFAPRSNQELSAALRAVVAAISPRDIAGWFAHCGYPPRHHPA